MFRSLRSFNFRIWFIGALVSNVGTWIQTTAINWYILTELTDGDAAAVGLAFAFQFAPALLLLPLTGWLSDRFERRRIIMITQTLLLIQVTVLGSLVLSGVANLPIMLLFSGLYGIISAIDIPVRQTFVTDLVAGGDVSNAIALNSASFNLGRLVGPAIAGGVLVLWGAGWAFLANGLSFLALLIAVLLLRKEALMTRPKRTQPLRVWGGFRYIRRRPDLMLVIVTLFLISAFTINIPLISATMVNMFEGDAADFGFVNSVVAAGSLAGALVAARMRRARLPVLFTSMALMSIAAFTAAVMPSILWYCVPLMLTGFSTILALATANAFVQTTSHPIVRGRVVAAYMAITMTASTIGAPIVGIVSDTWGARWAVAVGGLAALLALVTAVVWMGIGVPPSPVFDEQPKNADAAEPVSADITTSGAPPINVIPAAEPDSGIAASRDDEEPEDGLSPASA